MNTFTWLWLAWAVAFGVIELVALNDSKPGKGSLSRHVWRWVTKPHASKPANIAAWVGRVGIVGFCVWLAGHLAFGWWA